MQLQQKMNQQNMFKQTNNKRLDNVAVKRDGGSLIDTSRIITTMYKVQLNLNWNKNPDFKSDAELIVIIKERK